MQSLTDATTVAQSDPESSGVITEKCIRYRDLKINDEIEAYYDASYRRCRIVSHPVVSGNRVEFQILPIAKTTKFSPAKACFAADATVLISSGSFTPPKGRLDQRYDAAVLKALRPNCGFRTVQQILDEVRLISNLSFRRSVQEACYRLEKSGALVGRKAGRLNTYRRPLQFEIGLMVVENSGTASQRYGWVEELKLLKPRNKEMPVIHWIDGTRSFSSDELLEPVEDSLARKRIRMAQRIARGETQEGVIPIPWTLLTQLLYPPRKGKHSRINQHAVLEVAKLLGLLKQDAIVARAAVINRVFDYLDAHYDGWRSLQAVQPA